MNFLAILRFLAILAIVLGASMLLPAAISLGYGETGWQVFLTLALAYMAGGGVLAWLTRHATEIRNRDGYAMVTGGWVLAMALGGLPFLLLNAVPSFTDGCFEAMSGFTTTGASVLYNFDRYGHAVFFWRSLTNWIGGMGIIVLALVILPALGIGGMELYKKETSGPTSDKLTPRLRDTAKALWGIYAGLTGLEALVLMALGMGPFDAVNHAMSTLATGGFSPREASIMEYHSPAIEWAIVLFMILGGTNFSLHYQFLKTRGQLSAYWRDQEWRWYMGGALAATLAIALALIAQRNDSPFRALTLGAFQTATITTSTGFASDDFALWGPFPQFILFLLMITGGMAGSTSGGIKWIRVMMMFKFIRLEMVRLIHHKAVLHAKIGAKRVAPSVLNNIFAFFFLYLTIFIGATMVLTLDGNSIITSASGVASCMGNVGPGLEKLGPMANYSHLSDLSKWTLTICMLAGRLELMTVLMLFYPQTWRR